MTVGAGEHVLRTSLARLTAALGAQDILYGLSAFVNTLRGQAVCRRGVKIASYLGIAGAMTVSTMPMRAEGVMPWSLRSLGSV